MEIEKKSFNVSSAGAIRALEHTPVIVVPQERPILARKPIVGILLAILGVLLFTILAYNVKTNGPLTQADLPLAQALHADARHGPWPILLIAWGFSALGREGIMFFMLVMTIIWIRQKHWRELAMLIFGVGGGEALFQTLSGLIGRHRPVFSDPLEKLSGPGFPSGHSTTSIILFGLMLYLIWPKLPTIYAKILAVFITVLIVGSIGFGRMYIGDHFLTDILAGYSIGLAWAAAVFTGVEVAYWSHQPPWADRREPEKAK